MGKSIMQDEKYCYVTGSHGQLDRHHVFAGSRRKASEKYGCWIWLRHDIHMDLHDRDKALDKMLRRMTQERFEEIYGHEKFMEVFGKSYL